MKLIIIAAHSSNLVIGSGGTIPWNIPDDLQRFKQITMGHTILMGRKTFESIGRPLQGRRSVVLTSRQIPGLETYRSLDEALRALAIEEKIFILGGEKLFRETLPIADELHITVIRQHFEGDAFFPEYARIVSDNFRIVDFVIENDLEYRHYRRIGS
jgi:dihydrofolate reductase